MKIVIVLITILLFAGNIFAQDISQSNVPAVVLNSFQLEFPNAHDVKWKLEEGNYHVKYKVNSKPHDLTMDFRGKFLSHSQDLYLSEIPKAVLEAIGTKVPYFDLHDSDLHEIGDSVIYEIRFKHDGRNHYFYINKEGKLLKYRKELNDNEIPTSFINHINNKYGTIDIDRTRYVEEIERTIYIIHGQNH